MARGSSRRARGLSVKIKTKGGTIFEVDEKVARIFGKIRTEMTYNGTFQRSSSNQAVTRLHSPSPSHSLTNSNSLASLSSSLSSLAAQSLQQQHHCQCNLNNTNNQSNNSGTTNNVQQQSHENQSKHVNEPTDTDPNLSRHCPSPADCHSSPDSNPGSSTIASYAKEDEGRDKSMSPINANSSSNGSNGQTCSTSTNCSSLVCCSRSSLSSLPPPPPRTYYPRVNSDYDCNVITLEKTRGGIFALMLRWAKHHMNDPLIEFMERQEEMRNSGEGHPGSSLFKTPNTGRRKNDGPANNGPSKTPAIKSSSTNCVNFSALKSWGSNEGWLSDRADPRLDEVPAWDARFFSKLSRPQIYEMLHACSNLHVPLLTEMLAKTVADQMRGKSVEEVREEFGIVSDYTPEEEAALKEDYERYVERLGDGRIDEYDLDAAFRTTSIDNYRSIYGEEDDERLASVGKGRRCCGKMCNHRSNRGN